MKGQDLSRGGDLQVVRHRIDTGERAGWHMRATVFKWHDHERHAARLSWDEALDVPGNLLLNEGITRLLTLLIGTTTNPYNAANARIGVGDSSTAAAATQTALQGGNTLFKGMDSTYPSVSGTVLTLQSSFTSAEADFAWNEWSIDNGVTANENLNRKVATMGTKASGSTWTLQATVTIS